jgi:thioesterase domain-containing protein
MSGGDLDLQTARALHQQGRLPEALAMLDAVLAHRPEEVEALLRRAPSCPE